MASLLYCDYQSEVGLLDIDSQLSRCQAPNSILLALSFHKIKPWHRSQHGTRFPQEIRSHILSFAGRFSPDWKNARLVSRNWAETAARYIFREICLTPCTMHRLSDVQSLQTIQHHVKHLVLGTSIMPEVSWEQWQHGFSIIDVSDYFPQPTSSEVATRYEQYSELFHQQQRFIDGDTVHLAQNSTIEMPPFIAEAFQTFRHLSTVIIGEGPCLPSQQPVTYSYPLKPWCQNWQDLWMTQREPSIQPDISCAFERAVLENVATPGKSFPPLYQHLNELPHWSLLRQHWASGNNEFFRSNFFNRLCIIKFGDACGTPSEKPFLANSREGYPFNR
ncbi:MAG: hypothetical protein LQ350_006053 [Teloschistes chrysophthalmus]|nr:MAG: hypothetical protein LQ350_006053 [Niorma chrysophthalma]